MKSCLFTKTATLNCICQYWLQLVEIPMQKSGKEIIEPQNSSNRDKLFIQLRSINVRKSCRITQQENLDYCMKIQLKTLNFKLKRLKFILNIILKLVVFLW
eukprot:NODE_247_length_12991_cov_0.678328.p11 type:complete len:101 gc:universal NODE_247_length_12991_cov_0.678328:6331-6029(-)